MAHVPKSIIWQRSEQKGRQELPFHVVGLRQIGQRMYASLALGSLLSLFNLGPCIFERHGPVEDEGAG